MGLEQTELSRSREMQSAFQKKLLQAWTEGLKNHGVSELRSPVIHPERFIALLHQAQQEQKTLVFSALGCQDWVDAEWANPETDKLLGRIQPDGKRAKRFIQEMSSLSSALESFGVKHRIHFSLSNIEGLLHLHLNNMGLNILNEDAPEIMRDNVEKLAQKMQSMNASVVPFDHTQLLTQLTQASSLEDIQLRLTGKTAPSYREFLDALYAYDAACTAPSFVQNSELGPVWLDIQSFNFEKDVLSLETAFKTVAPEMPLLSIFPNAGNWRAATKPQATFASRSEIVANMLRVQPIPGDESQWMKKIHKSRDEDLIRALSDVYREGMSITNGQEKTFFSRLFYELAFGIDPLSHAL